MVKLMSHEVLGKILHAYFVTLTGKCYYMDSFYAFSYHCFENFQSV